MRKYATIFLLMVFFFVPVGHTGNNGTNKGGPMIDIKQTSERLKAHLKELTVNIGERSVRLPGNLNKGAEYITSFYKEFGVSVHSEPYHYYDRKVANVIAEISSGSNPSHKFLIGAHYDSVSGTVGADDNASAIAVQLETARNLKALLDQKELDLGVKFIGFV